MPQNKGPKRKVKRKKPRQPPRNVTYEVTASPEFFVAVDSIDNGSSPEAPDDEGSQVDEATPDKNIETVTYQLAAWKHAITAIEWFSVGIRADRSARMAFTNRLTGEHRNDLQQLVQKNFPCLHISASGHRVDRYLTLCADSHNKIEPVSEQKDTRESMDDSLDTATTEAATGDSHDQLQEQAAQDNLPADLEPLQSSEDKEQRGIAAIMAAVTSNEPAALKAAIQLHADVLPKGITDTTTETTPLHLAASHGYTDIVQMLIDCGAPLEQCDQRGETALTVARRHHQSGSAAALLQAGAVDKDSQQQLSASAMQQPSVSSPSETAPEVTAQELPLPSSVDGPHKPAEPSLADDEPSKQPNGTEQDDEVLGSPTLLATSPPVSSPDADSAPTDHSSGLGATEAPTTLPPAHKKVTEVDENSSVTEHAQLEDSDETSATLDAVQPPEVQASKAKVLDGQEETATPNDTVDSVIPMVATPTGSHTESSLDTAIGAMSNGTESIALTSPIATTATVAGVAIADIPSTSPRDDKLSKSSTLESVARGVEQSRAITTSEIQPAPFRIAGQQSTLTDEDENGSQNEEATEDAEDSAVADAWKRAVSFICTHGRDLAIGGMFATVAVIGIVTATNRRR